MAEKQMIPWTDYLIPLPQEIEVSDPVRIAADQIGLVVAHDASRMVAQAVDELRAAFREKSGCDPVGNSFTIHIGRLIEVGNLIDQAEDEEARLR